MPNRKLSDAERLAALQEINPVWEGVPFDPDRTTILAQDMPFFPGYRFLEVADFESDGATKRGFFIYKPGDVHAIDWSNDPFYKLAAKNFVLNAETAALYLRFFFRYVRGPQGRFLIIDHVDDVPWRDELPPSTRRAVAEVILPVQLVDQESDGSFIFHMCMLFKQALFESEVRVGPDGHVGLSEGDILINDMPVQDDVFGA